MTFASWRALFALSIAAEGYAAQTRTRYARELAIFSGFCESHLGLADVRDVGSEHILAYEQHLAHLHRSEERPRYRSSSQAGMLTVVRLAFRFLVHTERLLASPCDRLDLRRPKRYGERRTLSEEELARMLDAISGADPLSLRDRALFELLYGTGMRSGETLALLLTDVDLVSGRLLVREGKGGKDRLVPLGSKLCVHLGRYLEHGRPKLASRPDADRIRFFLTLQGAPLRHHVVELQLKVRLKAAGIEPQGVSPHVLRHSCATHLLASGAHLKQVAELLGHASMETTVVYTHFSPGSLRKVLKRFHPRENALWEDLIRLEERFRAAASSPPPHGRTAASEGTLSTGEGSNR